MKSSSKNKLLSIKEIDAFVFDFDGVLTDNKVLIDSNGNEMVVCSRADGLGFDALRKLNIPCLILSTEKNLVVSERAKKLKVEVFQAISNKADALLEIVSNRKLDIQRVFYVGNDINDYHVMQLCGYTACPNDSHIKIKKISDYTLLKNGGDGIVREILEEIFSLNLIKLIT